MFGSDPTGGFGNWIWGARNDPINQNPDEIAQEQMQEQAQEQGDTASSSNSKFMGLAQGLLSMMAPKQIAETLGNGVFSLVSAQILQSPESLQEQYERDMESFSGCEEFGEFLSQMGFQISNKITPGLLKKHPQNKDIIELLVKSIISKSFANLTALGKRSGIEKPNLLSLTTFFMQRVNNELEKVKTKEQTLEQATDKILMLLLPNGQADIPIADGFLTGQIKAYVWKLLQGYVADALKIKMEFDEAQSKEEAKTPIAVKQSSQKVANQLFDHANKLGNPGTEKIAQMVVTALGAEEADENFKARLTAEVQNIVSDLEPGSTGLRAQLIGIISPIIAHVQMNNTRGMDPKDYGLHDLVDDFVGVLVTTQDQASEVAQEVSGNLAKIHLDDMMDDDDQYVFSARQHKKENYADVADHLFKALGASSENPLPIGATASKMLHSMAAEQLSSFMADNTRIGHSSESVLADYKQRLVQCVGEETAEKYMAVCSVVGERAYASACDFIDARAPNSADQARSHTKKLVTSIALQGIVHALENSRAEGQSSASIKDIVDKVGKELNVIFTEHDKKIKEIILRHPEPSLDPKEALERQQKELVAELSGFTSALMSMLAAKPTEDSEQTPFSMPLDILVEKQWDNIGKEILPTPIAKVMLDMSTHIKDKEDNKKSIDAVVRFDEFVDENGKKVERSKEESFGSMFHLTAESLADAIPKVVEGVINDQTDAAVDKIIDLLQADPSPEAQMVIELLGKKDTLKDSLVSFIKENPQLMGNLKPLFTEYVESLALHLAKPLVVQLDKKERGIVVDKDKREFGDRRIMASMVLRVLEDINTHFEAINDIREFHNKSWAHEISHEQYMDYFQQGAPLTLAVIQAQEGIASAEETLRYLRIQRDTFTNKLKAINEQLGISEDLEQQEEINEKREGLQLALEDINTKIESNIDLKNQFNSLIRQESLAFLKEKKAGTTKQYIDRLESEGRLPAYYGEDLLSEVPLTKAVRQAREILAKAEGAKTALDQALNDNIGGNAGDNVVEAILDNKERIQKCKEIIENEEKAYKAAVKSGKGKRYLDLLERNGEISSYHRKFLDKGPHADKIREANRELINDLKRIDALKQKIADGGEIIEARRMEGEIAELTARVAENKEFLRNSLIHKKIASELTPQSKESLEALKNIKQIEEKITKKRLELSSAWSEEKKRACLKDIQILKEELVQYEKVVKAERVQRLQPLVNTVLDLIRMGKEDQIPVPEAVRQKLIDAVNEGGAKTLADCIDKALSRDSINEAMAGAMGSFNSAYSAPEGSTVWENIKGIYTRYYKPSAPSADEKEATDRDLEETCGSAIHKITRLIPNSIVKTAFGFKVIEDIGANVVGQLLHKPLVQQLSLIDLVDGGIAGGVNATISKTKGQGGEEQKVINADDVKNISELDRLIEAELKHLKKEQSALKAGRETVAHIKMDVLVATVKSIGSMIDAKVDKVFKHRSPKAQLFFKKVYLSALFDLFSKLIAIGTVPFLLLLEGLLRLYLSTRGPKVKELVHLDINESLADTIMETLIIELSNVLEEIKEEAMEVPPSDHLDDEFFDIDEDEFEDASDVDNSPKGSSPNLDEKDIEENK